MSPDRHLRCGLGQGPGKGYYVIPSPSRGPAEFAFRQLAGRGPATFRCRPPSGFLRTRVQRAGPEVPALPLQEENRLGPGSRCKVCDGVEKNCRAGLITLDRYVYTGAVGRCNRGGRHIQIQPTKSKLTLEGDRYALGLSQRKETRIVCTDEEMLFDWDVEKRRRNVAKHGLDFTRAIKIFSDITVERLSVKSDEVRFKATGYCEGIPLTVIYTWRGRKRRIISARRAKRNERREYREHVPERGNPRKG